MQMLIVSDWLMSPYSHIHVFSWKDRPSVEGYHASVLDLNLGEEVKVPFEEVSDGERFPYYSVSEEMERVLGVGGVVVCLTHITYINLESVYSESNPWHEAILLLKRRLRHAYKYTEECENCYDFLQQGFLQTTELDRINSRPSSQFKVTASSDTVKEYFRHVESFYKVIKGINTDEAGNQRIDWESQVSRLSSEVILRSDSVTVLAINAVTEEPIAAEVKYLGFPGSLVVLPAYEAKELATRSVFIVKALYDLAEEFYEANIRRAGVAVPRQEWTKQYRTEEAEKADVRIGELEQHIANARAERDKYDRMLVLLDGGGAELSDAVERVFGKEWFGFSVEKTEKGALLDMFVTDRSASRILAIEVTGVKHKLRRDDEHFTKFYAYRPTNAENNEADVVERMVLVANTFKEQDIASREEDITTPVRTLAEDNDFCIIRSSDLYRLWQDFISNKRKATDIFNEIFNTKGVFEYKAAS